MSLLALVFCTTELSAQSFTSFQYSVGVPFGGLKDHTNNVSGRGFTFEFHKEVAPSVSVGINLAYSVFYEQKDYGSYTQGTATLTGMQYRYNNVFPMLINAHYMFGEGMLIPYVGLGLGTIYDLRNTNMGLYSVEEKNWHFLISPEAGFLFDLSKDMSFKLNAKYDNAFKIHDADGFSNLSFNIGFVMNSW
jgi:outer membrane protein